MRSIAIIFNHKSGATGRLAEIKAYVTKLPPELYRVEIHNIEDDKKISAIAKQYTASEWDIIVAAGGDGTVSAVAGALVGSGRTLGVLPLGTLNHFAKDMSIPLKLSEALDLIIKGKHMVTIDVATCNEVTFINNSSIGIYPKMVELRERYEHFGLPKWFAFFFAARHVIEKIPIISVMLETEGQKLVRHTSFIFVGNNHYKLEGLRAGSRTTLSHGELSLWITRATTLRGFVRMGIFMILGIIRVDKDLDVFHPKEVEVETNRKELTVSFDGEVTRMQSPLRYKIVPQSLSVIVPELS